MTSKLKHQPHCNPFFETPKFPTVVHWPLEGMKSKKSAWAHVWICKFCLKCHENFSFVFADTYDPNEA